MTAIVVVVILCVGAVLAVTAQVRCIDAAREAARLAARGDHDQAVPAARRVAPDGARIDLHEAEGFVTARVRVDAALFPMLEVSAEAVAALEDSVVDEGGSR